MNALRNQIDPKRTAMQSSLKSKRLSCAQSLTTDLGLYMDGSHPANGHKDLMPKSHFWGQGYSLTLTCQARGLRRFVISMQEPWPHTAVIGRLEKSGKARVFAHGVLLLTDYLIHEGLFEEFSHDLSKALTC